MKSAILFLVFNRPDTTLEVFEAIKQAKPPRFYIAADGPRRNKVGETEKCVQVREIIMHGIDWNCEIRTLLRDENLGCGKAVSQAISWFFEQEEEGIILEDDVLPHPEFFEYCDILLERYRDNVNVKFISGRNALNGEAANLDSYYFSAFNYVWGWAAWRRTWDIYDFSLKAKTANEFNKVLDNYFDSMNIKRYWRNIFDIMKVDPFDTWDYQLTFSLWFDNAISILPNTNLIKNIGFGENATHTVNKQDLRKHLEYKSIFPITHPNKIVINNEADLNLQLRIENNTLTLIMYLIRYVKRRLIKIFRKLD
jgi:hypothetical protein